MRFFEFQVGNLPMVDLVAMYHALAANKRKQFGHINEDALRSADEYRNFVGRFVTSPDKLTVGQQYYVVSLVAMPANLELHVDYSNSPVEFLGKSDTNFLFQTSKSKFQLPGFYDDAKDVDPYIMSTTVYSTLSDAEQFLTLLALQFTGRWKIHKKELMV